MSDPKHSLALSYEKFAVLLGLYYTGLGYRGYYMAAWRCKVSFWDWKKFRKVFAQQSYGFCCCNWKNWVNRHRVFILSFLVILPELCSNYICYISILIWLLNYLQERVIQPVYEYILLYWLGMINIFYLNDFAVEIMYVELKERYKKLLENFSTIAYWFVWDQAL